MTDKGMSVCVDALAAGFERRRTVDGLTLAWDLGPHCQLPRSWHRHVAHETIEPGAVRPDELHLARHRHPEGRRVSACSGDGGAIVCHLQGTVRDRHVAQR